jgi:hypothetical protein
MISKSSIAGRPPALTLGNIDNTVTNKITADATIKLSRKISIRASDSNDPGKNQRQRQGQ